MKPSLTLLVIALCSPFLAASEPPLEAGTAAVDITPKEIGRAHV
jgi:hypothetical protein